MTERRDAWITYLLMVCQGFLFYAVGYLTPYVETELGAPTWASALPNTTMAVGLLVAAVLVPRVVRILGDWGAVRLWAVLLAATAVVIGLGASLPSLLGGAFVVGLAGAGALTHAVTSFAGRRNGVLLMRATLASVIGGVIGPLVLSAAARGGAWSLGILVPVPLALVLAALAPVEVRRRAAAGTVAAVRDREPPLTGAYWLAWGFLVLCIGAESSFVAWGAQVAVEQAGIALADATALGSLFVLGLVLGRVALGARPIRIGARRLLALMVASGVVGGLLVWAGQVVLLAGAGLLLGGLGLAGVWATAAGLAVANAPRSPVLAGARLNLASGVAVLVAPLVLGVVASLAGVLAAWGVVVGLLVAALAVLRLVPVGRPAAAVPVSPEALDGVIAGPG
jgi:MFS family permease